MRLRRAVEELCAAWGCGGGVQRFGKLNERDSRAGIWKLHRLPNHRVHGPGWRQNGAYRPASHSRRASAHGTNLRRPHDGDAHDLLLLYGRGDRVAVKGGRAWSWTLSVALAAVLLYLSLRGVDWKGVWQTVAGARWGFLAAACGCSCFSFFLRALRWRILLNAEERLSVGTVFSANMAGSLGNSFLPARAGELVRTIAISTRSARSKTYGRTTALSERRRDAIALVLWSSLILLGDGAKPRWIVDLSRTTAVAAGAGALAIALLPHMEGVCRNRLPRFADQVLLGVRAFHNVGRLVGFTVLTVAIWMMDAFGVMLGAYGLHLHFSFTLAMLLLTGMGLGSALTSTRCYVGI